MSTKTMSIALPDTLKQYVEKRVTTKGYGNVSEYFRDLIRADQQREADERLEALLLEGLHSGEPIEATADYVAKKLAKLKAKHTK